MDNTQPWYAVLGDGRAALVAFRQLKSLASRWNGNAHDLLKSLSFSPFFNMLALIHLLPMLAAGLPKLPHQCKLGVCT